MSDANTTKRMSPADPGGSCGEGTCGCCEGTRVETPAEVNNRPALPAVAYRVGTHSQFKRSMLARLSDSARPALLNLRTRDDDDFTIALIDAWAVVGDVLTFDQERIANESYLRTATERVSVLELARLIDYQLRPGVAASTFRLKLCWSNPPLLLRNRGGSPSTRWPRPSRPSRPNSGKPCCSSCSRA